MYRIKNTKDYFMPLSLYMNQIRTGCIIKPCPTILTELSSLDV